MGPSLQDSRWHFGGTPGEVFQSIYEGRPDGMPSWGGRIDDDADLAARRLCADASKGHDVTTENFTGKTVARTGTLSDALPAHDQFRMSTLRLLHEVVCRARVARAVRQGIARRREGVDSPRESCRRTATRSGSSCCISRTVAIS